MAEPIRKEETNNVIELRVVDGKLFKKPAVRYNKDGSIDKRHPNRVAGVSSEVYPFTTKEEIKAVIDVFNKHIEEATNENQRQIAHRNKMMFLVGLNIGIRASDLCSLKYSFFMNPDRTFKDSYKLQPKKTKKTGKFVTLHFNSVVKKAISDYIEMYPVENLNEYLFKSRKGNGAISENSLWRIVSNTAIEAGIKQNIGSHSLRKTFGRFVWHESRDKNEALVLLQFIFNHSSPAITSKYIGITDDEVSDVFNGLNLGMDYI